jgi:hypothetical protein
LVARHRFSPPILVPTPCPPSSNPEWGYRDTDTIADLGRSYGFTLTAIQPMPANNFFLILEKEAEKQGDAGCDSA